MKIDFKYAILAPLFGALVVGAMICSAPMLLSVVGSVTAGAGPSDDDVCAHLDTLEIELGDCLGWLEKGREPLGEYYDNRSRCILAATDQAQALRCDEPIEYMTGKWE